MSDIRGLLADTAAKIMKDLCTKELVTEAETGVWPSKLWDALEEAGMTSVGVSEAAGGVGGDFGDAMALLKIAGKFAAPIPLAETLLANSILGLANLPLQTGPLTYAPVQKEDHIKFEEITNGWVVSGTASFIPWARDAHHMVVMGMTTEQQPVVALLNLGQYEINKATNLAGEPRDEVSFHDVLLDKANVVIDPAIQEQDIWNQAALTRVALMAGALDKVLDLTITYAKERTQFGRAIGKFQAIKQQIAVLAGEVTASEIAANSAIAAYEKNQDEYVVAMAKIQLGAATNVVTKIAHQVHAAMGFTDEHPLQQSTRRLWSWRDEYGTESEWSIELGDHILSNGSEGLWPFVTNTVHRLKVEK